MKFCDWLSFNNIQTESPDQPGVFQVKIKKGLIDYPTGKSAMFYYGYTNNLNKGLAQFCTEILPVLNIDSDLIVMRWLVVSDTETQFKKYMDLFLTKFGSLPQ